MFDVGFSELLVIGVVALIVIGPERLPKVARTVGLLVGRLQRYVNDVKADINREMELDELRKIQTQFQAEAKELETSIAAQVGAAEQALNQTIAPVSAALDEAGKAVDGAAAGTDSAGLDAVIQAGAGGIASVPLPLADIPIPPGEYFDSAPEAAETPPPAVAAIDTPGIPLPPVATPDTPTPAPSQPPRAGGA